MRIAPPSADLLIKIAIGAAALIAGYFILKKAKAAASTAIDAVAAAPGRLYETVKEYGAGAAEAVKEAIGANGLTYPPEWRYVDPERVWEDGPM